MKSCSRADQTFFTSNDEGQCVSDGTQFRTHEKSSVAHNEDNDSHGDNRDDSPGSCNRGLGFAVDFVVMREGKEGEWCT